MPPGNSGTPVTPRQALEKTPQIRMTSTPLALGPEPYSLLEVLKPRVPQPQTPEVQSPKLQNFDIPKHSLPFFAMTFTKPEARSAWAESRGRAEGLGLQGFRVGALQF